MKKFFLLLLFVSFVSNIQSQSKLYENPKFDSIAKSHKTIAIIPFKAQVKLRPRQLKNMTNEQLHDLEKAEGESIQSAMYSWFLKRKKRGKLQNLEVQDPKSTTVFLKKKDIDYNNITDYTPQELAEILKVDAVITGELETNKPMSEGAAIAIALLVGFWGNTNSAIINMSVHDKSSGILLWNYNKIVRGSSYSSPEDLINVLMRKASRRLAYTKND